MLTLSKIHFPKIKLCLIKGLALMSLSMAIQSMSFAQGNSDEVLQMQTLFAKAQGLSTIYEAELGEATQCDASLTNGIKACFASLRNDGNAPYILLPRISPAMPAAKGVVVLFHGLSDSPYFVQSLAEHLRIKGFVVIAPLTPGHGKLSADADMQDENLKSRWYGHIDSVMALAQNMAQSINDGPDLPVIVGGFSTGGAFASYYTINNPEKVSALLLFSGALELSGAAESLSNIWGMKSLAKWLDGDYETQGAHPYKYPSVATYSALVLMDVIHDIRDLLEIKKVKKAIFAAHSMADKTTLYSGIEDLTTHIQGAHTVFKIDESYELCHADILMSSVQIVNLKFDKTKVNENEKCAVPKANPLHQNMLLMLDEFLSAQLP